MTNDERRTTNDRRPATDDRRPAKTLSGRWSVAGRRWSIAALLCCLALLLSGCMLISGDQTTSDARPSGGNLSTSFVSAEGEELQTLATGAGPTTMSVIVIMSLQQGELRLEMLDPSGSVTLAVEGRPDEQITKSGNIATDAQGNLRYRVIARGARNGGYQVLYQPAGQ